MKELILQRIKEFDDIQVSQEFNLNEFQKWSKDIILEMTEVSKYYENVFLSIQSTIEPYENYPGEVQVSLWGSREMNQEEIEEEKAQKEIEALSIKLGITFYEASIVKKLQEKDKCIIIKE